MNLTPRFTLTMLVFSLPALAEGPALTGATTALKAAQRDFAQCKNGKLQVEFAATLPRLEAARRSLEKSRREVESARRSLETARKRIEAGHEQKQERYAEALATRYSAPMQALTPVMQSYVAGIKSYASLMQRYADFCATPGITTASARAFVSSLQPEVAALTDDSQAVMVAADKVSVSDVAAR